MREMSTDLTRFRLQMAGLWWWKKDLLNLKWYMDDSWINDCVAFCIMEKDIVFWWFYFFYLRVIILEHVGYSKVRISQCCLFTFWEALIIGNVPLKNIAFLYFYVFLIFLITEKIISLSLLCFLTFNFAIILYLKTFIKFLIIKGR